MTILPVVLACPPPDNVIWLIRLEEYVTVMLFLFPATLLLVASIAIGIHAGRASAR